MDVLVAERCIHRRTLASAYAVHAGLSPEDLRQGLANARIRAPPPCSSRFRVTSRLLVRSCVAFSFDVGIATCREVSIMTAANRARRWAQMYNQTPLQEVPRHFAGISRSPFLLEYL